MATSVHAAMAAALALLLHITAALGCTMQDGTRYDGVPLTTLTATASKDTCCFECRANPTCSAFTFFVAGANANKCVLYAANSWAVAADPTAVSGIATGICEFEDGVEYPLFTSQVVANLPNKESCCYWCSTTIKCAGFTYFKSTKQCALKYSVANRIPSPNLSSGTVVAGSAGVCTFEDGFKYSGFDMRAVPNVPTKAACCAACQGAPPCAAFSYAMSGPQAKTCTLKSASVNRLVNPNAVSAPVRGLSCMDAAAIRK